MKKLVWCGLLAVMVAGCASGSGVADGESSSDNHDQMENSSTHTPSEAEKAAAAVMDQAVNTLMWIKFF